MRAVAGNLIELENVNVPRSPMVVMLASGPDDDGKKAVLAYSAAVTAISMDLPTQVFLVGDGAHWAYRGNTEEIAHAGFPALSELIDAFQELGGKTYICSTCDKVCGIPGDEQKVPRLKRPDVLPRGMASVLSDVAQGSSVTF